MGFRSLLTLRTFEQMVTFAAFWRQNPWLLGTIMMLASCRVFGREHVPVGMMFIEPVTIARSRQQGASIM